MNLSLAGYCPNGPPFGSLPNGPDLQILNIFPYYNRILCPRSLDDRGFCLALDRHINEDSLDPLELDVNNATI